VPESVPVRYQLRVKQRTTVVEFAMQHGIKPASRYFGLDRRTIRAWLRRWRQQGAPGWVPRYPQQRKRRISPEVFELIRLARFEHEWGAPRTRIWLARVHRVYIGVATIQRAFRALGRPRLLRTKPRRRPRQLRLFEKEQPGDAVQVDVTIVKLRRHTVFQYTALDDCTRLRVLRLYPRQNQYASLHCLGEVQRGFPFAIRQLQGDNGSEFPLAFARAVQAAGIRHRYLRPRRPQQNGKVERSHRIDQEEFWGRHGFATIDEAEGPLGAWEQADNHTRFSSARAGLTPFEKLQAKQGSSADGVNSIQ
jgi:transposase InsO family protein